jgi:hypothetical protein
MPTIAEILASKKAAASAAVATGQPVTYASTAPRETLAERAELKAAIDRIDPPGKSARREAAKGIVLTMDLPPAFKNGEPRGQAHPIKGPEELRSLSLTEGEALPLAPMEADPCIKDWHRAMTAFETELVVMNDPLDPERAWLAVRLDEDPLHPLLLKALPFYEHPRTVRPENEPF